MWISGLVRFCDGLRTSLLTRSVLDLEWDSGSRLQPMYHFCTECHSLSYTCEHTHTRAHTHLHACTHCLDACTHMCTHMYTICTHAHRDTSACTLTHIYAQLDPGPLSLSSIRESDLSSQSLGGSPEIWKLSLLGSWRRSLPLEMIGLGQVNPRLAVRALLISRGLGS